MNFTESFLIQMALTYLSMMLQTNTTMTADQKTAVTNAIAANESVVAAFTKA